VFAAEHLLGLGGVYLFFEPIEGLRQVCNDIFTALRPFEKDADVVDLLVQAVAKLDIFGKATLPLQRLLCLDLVVPETRRGNFLFQLGQLTRIMGTVKDSSAYQTRVSANLSSGGSDHQ
jgi:hypothetical protein